MVGCVFPVAISVSCESPSSGKSNGHCLEKAWWWWTAKGFVDALERICVSFRVRSVEMD